MRTYPKIVMVHFNWFHSFLVLFCLTPALAKLDTKHVTIENIPEKSLKPGSQTEITVPLKIREGFHIQANPAGSANLIPTTLTVSPSPSAKLIVGPVIYPPGKPYKLRDAIKEILVYGKAVKLKVPLEIATDAQPGRIKVDGTVRYQACDDKTCLFPTTDHFSFFVRVD